MSQSGAEASPRPPARCSRTREGYWNTRSCSYRARSMPSYGCRGRRPVPNRWPRGQLPSGPTSRGARTESLGQTESAWPGSWSTCVVKLADFFVLIIENPHCQARRLHCIANQVSQYGPFYAVPGDWRRIGEAVGFEVVMICPGLVSVLHSGLKTTSGRSPRPAPVLSFLVSPV